MSAAAVSAARSRALAAVRKAEHAREALNRAMQELVELDEGRACFGDMLRAGDHAAQAWVYAKGSAESIDESAARLDAMQRALFEATRS